MFVSNRATSMSNEGSGNNDGFVEARHFGLLDNQSSLGISPVLLSILAYFFAWLGALIIIVFEKKNTFSLFHAWQSFLW